MHIKTIIAGAAIVVAATIGMVSADDQFSTLEGVTVVAMSSGELDAVAGKTIHFRTPASTGPADLGNLRTGEPPPGHKFHHTGRNGTDDCGGGVCLTQAVSYNGLLVAADNFIKLCIPGGAGGNDTC